MGRLRHFHIRQGDPAPQTPAPAQQVENIGLPREVALLGRDIAGVRPRFVVSEGEGVTCGQTLFTDRKHPQIAFVSPVSGVVSKLTYGSRRTLDLCVVTVAPEDEKPSPHKMPDAAPRELLQTRGMWPAFVTRPFGRMPAPDAVPDAIIVNAVHTSPQAPDPAVVLEGQRDAFHLGLSVLTKLTPADVFLCQSPGKPLGPEGGRIIHASFSGTMAAGLPGTQIDRLCPVDFGGAVWSVGYQDVIAIGYLFGTGTYMARRVVSITGPQAATPKLVRSVLGARLAELSEGGAVRILSGNQVTGRDAQFLGRFDDQVTLLEPRPQAADPSRQARRATILRPLIPSASMEKAVATDTYAIPLARALSVGDSDAAQRLGCLGLIEEDVATLTRRCTSGTDYAAMLRRVLDELELDAA